MHYKNKDNLSPVIFFCFNRLDHLIDCINSLKRNELAKKTTIIFYSDGPKKNTDILKVRRIRRYLINLKGFKKKKLVFRNKNFGTKKNITQGINETFKKYDKAIILEDDIIVGKYFLKFMNFSLDNYFNQKNIWHINGWSYPFMKKSSNDINFLRSMNCWGWATWKDRWKHLSLDDERLIKKFTNKKIHKFNIFSTMDHFSQILRNKRKTLSSWAVYWHATIFLKKGICIYPKFSMVRNIGFDGSGRMSSQYQYKSYINNNFKKYQFNDYIVLDKKLINQEFLYYFQKKRILRKIVILIKKFLYKYL
jgi:GR25 family glycosyltransferase involved in LPS biosynthesis